MITQSQETTPLAATKADGSSEIAYIAMKVGGQIFGLPINDVHEVFSVTRITPVPLAPPMVTGLINLRGRVVTAICLRTLLGMDETPGRRDRMAVGLESGGELFALLVDSVGDVMRLRASTLEPCPVHIGGAWRSVSHGVHRLETGILVILDLKRALGTMQRAA
jgi:purine-binding chemotaxis protein CheW